MSISIDWFLKFVIIFFLLFDTNFSFLPGFTTARVVFAILLFITVLKKSKSKIAFSRAFFENNISFLAILGFVFIVASIQYLLSDDITQLGRLFYFTMYCIFAPFMLKSFVKYRKQFAIYIGIAVFVQSILTLTSYFVPSIKDLFRRIILYNSNFAQEDTFRAFGFVSVGGAAFSVIQFTGVASLLYILSNYKLNNLTKWFTWIFILVILIATLFIGRTGLFLSLLAIFIFFISQRPSLRTIFILFLAVVLVLQFNFINLLEKSTANLDGFDLDLFLAWLNSGFQLNNDLVIGLRDMPIPELNFRTIVGTGLVKDPSGLGNASGHDTGYIQSYYSLGLICAIIFYLNYYLYLFYNIRKKWNTSLFLLFLALVFIESKESFIFSYTYPFFLLSFIIMENDPIEPNDVNNHSTADLRFQAIT